MLAAAAAREPRGHNARPTIDPDGAEIWRVATVLTPAL